MKLLVLAVFVTVASSATFESKVVGGQDAAEGQFPHQISIKKMNEHHCGGTILNKRWIVTAAHCTDGQIGSKFQVIAGVNELQDTNGQEFKVIKVVQHENYTYNSEYFTINDISLLKLNKDIVFNAKVKAIKVNTQPISDGSTVTLSGWGRTSCPGEIPNKLQFINLKTISNKICNDRTSGTIIDSELCTFTKVGEGSCSGDSGGPLIYEDKLVGIVSYGTPCARGFPDIYTRVSHFADWIENNMK